MAKKLLERLRHKIDVYAKSESKTEFAEITYDYKKITSVWAEVKPISGKENSIKGDSAQVSVTHRIITRSEAIKKPRNDMYFVFKGQKYEIEYFSCYYKCVIEFYCKLIIEGDKDYGQK